jgi:hypothetical protein
LSVAAGGRHDARAAISSGRNLKVSRNQVCASAADAHKSTGQSQTSCSTVRITKAVGQLDYNRIYIYIYTLTPFKYQIKALINSWNAVSSGRAQVGFATGRDDDREALYDRCFTREKKQRFISSK